jgi:hypothetical protein
MALELSINVSLSSNGKTMTFTETTGAYNVNLNPTGWGSPNEVLTNIGFATLSITTPDNTTKTLFYTKGQYYGGGFSSNFPDSTETYTFDITKALNSKFSLDAILGNGSQVTYTTFAAYHNFTTSSLLNTTGSSITGYNITNAYPVSVGNQTFIITGTTTGTPTLTNSLAYSSNTTTEAFDDGVYKFVYTVDAPIAKTSYTATTYLLVTTAVACCVDKLFHLASQA